MDPKSLCVPMPHYNNMPSQIKRKKYKFFTNKNREKDRSLSVQLTFVVSFIIVEFSVCTPMMIGL